MTISIDDLLNTHGMGTSGNQNTGRLIPKTARLVVKQPTANVVLPPELAYDANRDILIIYINQRALAKDVEYSILSDGKTIQRKGGTFDAGSVFDFLVVTNIKTDIPTFDGSLLGEGSVVESKLAKEVRDKLAATLGMDKVREDIEQLETKTRMMREVSANTQLLTEAGDLVASGTTFGGNGTYEFGNKPDQKGTKTTVAIPAGTTSLVGKVDPVELPTFTYVTIYDDVNNEDVFVTNGTSGELTITPTKYAYKLGAAIKRSTLIPVAAGKGYTFPTWNGNPVNRGTLRIAQGWTDEVVLWTTQNDDLQMHVKMSYIGADDKDVIGTKRAGTELVSATHLGDASSVDLAKSNYHSIGYTVFNQFEGNEITDFSVDSKKNVLVATSGNIGSTVLQKLDVNGKVLWTNKELGKAVRTAFSPDGSFYVAYDLPVGQKLFRRFSAEGVEVASVVRTSAHAKPIKMKACANGDVILAFANTTGPSIRRYSATGAFLWEYTVQGVVDMDVDPSGYASVLRTGGDLYRIKPDGQLDWLTPTTVYGNESCLVCDRRGNTTVGYYNLQDLKEHFNKSRSEDAANPSRLLKRYNASGTLVWDVKMDAIYLHFISLKIVSGSTNTIKESADLLACDAEGNLTIKTFSMYRGSYNVNFAKLDPNGKILSYDRTPELSHPYRRVVISDDGYMFTDYPTHNSYFTYNETVTHPGGLQISERDLNGLQRLGDSSETLPAYHSAVDLENSVYIVRHDYYEPYQEMEPQPVSGESYLVKYDKDGRELWRKRYGYTVHQVCVDDANNVYIATSGADSVIKLDKEGNRLWGKGYKQHAFAIAAVPGGGCVVGYKYCTYHRLGADGSLLYTNTALLGYGVTDEKGVLRSQQPKKILVDSNKLVYVLQWPYSKYNPVYSMTDKLVIRDYQIHHAVVTPEGYTPPLTLPNGAIFYPYPDISLDKNNHLYYASGIGVSKQDSNSKILWTGYTGYKAELDTDGYLSERSRYQLVAVTDDLEVYVYSSTGVTKFGADGRRKGQFSLFPVFMTPDHLGNLHTGHGFAKDQDSAYYYSTYKLGRFKKAKTWSIVEDNKTWYIRTLKSTASTLTLQIDSGSKTTRETIELTPGANFRYPLLPENFSTGLNVLRFSFDNDGYEEWQVTRTSESLSVTQFLATTDEVQLTDLTLEVRREAGSRSIVHKYLGGIG